MISWCLLTVFSPPLVPERDLVWYSTIALATIETRLRQLKSLSIDLTMFVPGQYLGLFFIGLAPFE
jgi:hypothetical protein